MKNREIRMKDIVKRNWPDFVIKYSLIDEEEIRYFPGSLLNFSYVDQPDINDVFCDIFSEFKKSAGADEHIPFGTLIPQSGVADMWIVSDRNKGFHFENLSHGKTCYLSTGGRVVAECTIVEIYNELKLAQ